MALKTDLVSYYSFDVNAGDDHGSYDGTVSGATHTSSGKLDDAYSFDGNNDIISRSSSSHLENNDFSVSLWVKPDSTKTSAQYVFSFGRAKLSRYYGYHIIINSDRTITFFTGGSTSPYYNNLVSTGTVTRNAWNHIVVTFDNTNNVGKIYINGGTAEEFTSLKSIAYSSTYRNFRLGNITDASDNYYLKGVLDEVAVWSRAITSSEVSEIYNSGSGLAYTSWDAGAGWTGKINGVTNPAKINGIAVANIAKVNGQ